MGADPNRFVRRTSLGADEYRKNFRQIDRDAIGLVTSAEARGVTQLMGTLYLALVDAPDEYWEREGVLRFAGAAGEGGTLTAWRQLVALLGCGNTTAKKALDWMHRQGVIGYYAGRNGAGIRIFLNRAVSSIGRRGGQKNLRLVRAPAQAALTPAAGTPSSDSFADPESLDQDFDPRAPQNGAAEHRPPVVEEKSLRSDSGTPAPIPERFSRSDDTNRLGGEELIERLAKELAPHVRAAAAREHERTREWFDKHALPKAIRVSQRAAFDMLRAQGVITETRGRRATGLDVGRRVEPPASEEPLTDADVAMLAESCVALFEAQGRPVESTLAEMAVGAGGFLGADDTTRVRAAAEALMCRREAKGQRGGA